MKAFLLQEKWGLNNSCKYAKLLNQREALDIRSALKRVWALLRDYAIDH